MTREAWIIDAIRTPIGRHSGALAAVRPDDLAAIPLRALVSRNQLDPARVEDVLLGCANGAGEDNRNVARMAGMLADYPVSVPGQTINRLCGSGMQAVNSAAHAIVAGDGEIFAAGGVESMSRAPWVLMKPASGYARGAPPMADTVLGWRFVNRLFPERYTVSLGETAERVADKYGISREDQDAYAYESQRRTAAAQEAGRLDAELIPVQVTGRKGAVTTVDRDEHPRPETTIEALSKLRPAFRKDGTVTAGNASGLNDGAAALLVVSADRARAEGWKPMARIVATAVAGVEPDLMGMGPVPATARALERAGLSVADMDLIELNEAFAAQSVACVRQLDADPDRVNVNGGAIALGHPLGCSGARILITLIHELKRRGGGMGLATMCIGVGQGIATVVEVYE